MRKNSKKPQISPFRERVMHIIRSIPEGNVMSYGQIALYAGLPRAARQVGWLLRNTKEDLPWWRVINSKGTISIEGNWHADKSLQKKLLEREGIEVSNDMKIDMETYRFKATDEYLQKIQLPQEYIKDIVVKYGI